MQKSSVNLGFYAKILQGTVSWQYGRAQEHWAFEDFDNHTILTTPIVTRRLRIANSREIEDTHHVGGHGSLAWQISGDESFQS